uniref:interleukin-17D isoform X2 n=1 Tax=Callithrix jacchus TaxID=9483 RepID=UPI00159E12E9|nr:interleukin-17D isoform X2 [Callithrix jacchus]
MGLRGGGSGRLRLRGSLAGGGARMARPAVRARRVTSTRSLQRSSPAGTRTRARAPRTSPPCGPRLGEAVAVGAGGARVGAGLGPGDPAGGGQAGKALEGQPARLPSSGPASGSAGRGEAPAGSGRLRRDTGAGRRRAPPARAGAELGLSRRSGCLWPASCWCCRRAGPRAPRGRAGARRGRGAALTGRRSSWSSCTGAWRPACSAPSTTRCSWGRASRRATRAARQGADPPTAASGRPPTCAACLPGPTGPRGMGYSILLSPTSCYASDMPNRIKAMWAISQNQSLASLDRSCWPCIFLY